ncbi:MAG: ABC transporter substrate-binding protein, partial [Candidatus Hodarchaeota archaeon]
MRFKFKMSIVLLVIAASMLMVVPTPPAQAQVTTYSIDLWYTPTHYGDTEKDVAELIKSQLEATGCFDVTLQSAEWATYVNQFGSMGFFLLGWWTDYPDESNYISPFVGTSGGASIGTNYSSVTMDGYITTMTTSTNATERMEAIRNAQKLMAEDIPCIPLFTQTEQF